MEIPGPTELAFLRFKGKRLFSVMGSQNQRGTEANSNARAPSLAHSQNLGNSRAAGSSYVQPAGDGR